jgi:hypothetical protein
MCEACCDKTDSLKSKSKASFKARSRFYAIFIIFSIACLFAVKPYYLYHIIFWDEHKAVSDLVRGIRCKNLELVKSKLYFGSEEDIGSEFMRWLFLEVGAEEFGEPRIQSIYILKDRTFKVYIGDYFWALIQFREKDDKTCISLIDHSTSRVEVVTKEWDPTVKDAELNLFKTLQEKFPLDNRETQRIVDYETRRRAEETPENWLTHSRDDLCNVR